LNPRIKKVCTYTHTHIHTHTHTYTHTHTHTHTYIHTQRMRGASRRTLSSLSHTRSSAVDGPRLRS
jgi:carbohydrate-binding DOMON domain-containing protein